jgi:hypothetical protein
MVPRVNTGLHLSNMGRKILKDCAAKPDPVPVPPAPKGVPMATRVTFKKIQTYLDAIADNANNDIGNSPHLRFWNVDYKKFTTGNVPLRATDPVTPIIDQKNPEQSSFYRVLLGPWKTFRQMPGGGPKVAETTYDIAGTKVPGTQILADIREWLVNSYPENGS